MLHRSPQGWSQEPNTPTIGPRRAARRVGQGASTATPDIDNVACGDVVSLVVTETFLVDGEELECASEEQTVALDVVALPQPEVTTDSPLCKGTDVVLDLTDNIVSGCTNDSIDYVGP